MKDQSLSILSKAQLKYFGNAGKRVRPLGGSERLFRGEAAVLAGLSTSESIPLPPRAGAVVCL